MSDIQVSWPIDALQRLFGSIRHGKLVLIAGRPGTAKGILALQMAAHNASNIPVLYIDTRPGRALMGRTDNWIAKLQADGVNACVVPNLMLERLEDMITEHVATHGPSLVVLNTLQDVTHEGSESAEDEHPTLGHISASLKRLAMDQRLVIVCVSQVEEEADLRPGRMPHLYHLQGSGALEGNADQVYFLWRDHALKIGQAKNRTGAPQRIAADLALDQHDWKLKTP